MSYKLIPLENFEKNVKQLAKKYPSLQKDLEAFEISIIQNPIQGKSLGKDCYKIRLAIKSKGKGKSGGGRIITCVKVIKDKIYLLAIYDKSEKEDIADSEFKELLKLIE
jgi:mRNA-degrading endonuclease RelE of RelBE toxin-antitoxin system